MSANGAWRHDAFISYSTLASAKVGAALELVLETFGRRWDEPRARDIFRDVSDQPATADLAADLLAHLDRSRFLIYIASPQASESPWVQQELEHWISARGTGQLLLVLGEGRLAWDDGAGCFDETSTVPDQLRTAFRSQPKWVSLDWVTEGFDVTDERFAAAVADLAATLDGVPRAVLEERHRRQHRRALAHRLAAGARDGIDAAADLGLLLAATASELDDNVSTRRALASSLEATSSLVVRLGSAVPVTAASRSVDPDCFLVGLTDGAVERWSDTERHERIEPGRHVPVTALAEDGRGRLAVGFADGSVEMRDPTGHVKHWRPGTEPIEAIAVHPTAEVVATASPGGTVRVHAPAGSHTYDGLIHVHLLRFTSEVLEIFAWSALCLVDLRTWSLTEARSLAGLARPGPVALAEAGERWVQCQLDGGGVLVTSLGTDEHFFVQARRGFLDAAALDPAGQWLAIAAGGRLFVYDLDAEGRLDRTHLLVDRSVRRLVVGVDGRWVLALQEGGCEVHAPRESTLCTLVQPHTVDVPAVVQAALDVSFSVDGSLLAAISSPVGSAGRPAEVSVWDSATLRKVTTLTPPDAAGLEFLDARHLRMQALDGTTTIHDMDTGTASPDAVAMPVPRVHVATRSDTWGLTVAVDGDVIDLLEEEGPLNITWAVNADGTRLLRSTSHGLLTLRDLEAGADLWSVMFPHCDDLAFSPAGDLLAGVTGSGLLLLVDDVNGEVNARLEVPDAPLHRMSFDPAGRHLAVVSPGGPLTLVDTDVASWRRIALRRAGRALTQSERQSLGLHDPWV